MKRPECPTCRGACPLCSYSLSLGEEPCDCNREEVHEAAAEAARVADVDPTDPRPALRKAYIKAVKQSGGYRTDAVKAAWVAYDQACTDYQAAQTKARKATT